MSRMPVADWPVEWDPVYGCWLWVSEIDRDGYGIRWLGRRPTYAHRLVYRSEAGPIADGLVLDHLCRRRNCVAPHHLEPVKKRENERRKHWSYRVRQRKCRHGHDMYEHGRRTPEGGRICRVCSGL